MPQVREPLEYFRFYWVEKPNPIVACCAKQAGSPFQLLHKYVIFENYLLSTRSQAPTL